MGAGGDSESSRTGDAIWTVDESPILSPLLAKDEDDRLDTLADVEVPPWDEQITFRGILVSILLGAMFCIITHKLNFVIGVIPSLNVAAGLLGFFFIKLWTGTLSQLGFWSKPFTRQENTVIQTTVVSCYGLAFSGKLKLWIQGHIMFILVLYVDTVVHISLQANVSEQLLSRPMAIEANYELEII